MQKIIGLLLVSLTLSSCSSSSSQQQGLTASNVQLTCSSLDLDATATASCTNCTFTVPQNNSFDCQYSCTCKVIQAFSASETNNATYDAINNDCAAGTQSLTLGVGVDGTLHCVGSGNTATEQIQAGTSLAVQCGLGYINLAALSLVNDFGLPCSLFQTGSPYDFYVGACADDNCYTWGNNPCDYSVGIPPPTCS